ncbi:hypothetical protein [Polyangium sp. y55x31]|uniref:hypothetical protein n=1 Tax=Polyangium sp. y55x31 TaxID=3042688 RepID=UPI0024829143|nr:hypothetical protein [Polyangium sp. y55x31]MDI1484082.1 hypothetical protein [Polyangium sp. y55x31]
MDPDDRQALRDRLAGMAPEDIILMRRTVMNAKGINYFSMVPEADQVGKIQCRVFAGNQWGNWQDQEPSWIVYDLLRCLKEVPLAVTYLMCKDEWVSTQTTLKKQELLESQIPGTDVECRFVFDWRYEPDKVPESLWKEESISFDDMIDVLVSLPAPPPGFVAPELAPLLCPLGAGPGWGCPSDPATETDPPEGGG